MRKHPDICDHAGCYNKATYFDMRADSQACVIHKTEVMSRGKQGEAEGQAEGQQEAGRPAERSAGDPAARVLSRSQGWAPDFRRRILDDMRKYAGAYPYNSSNPCMGDGYYHAVLRNTYSVPDLNEASRVVFKEKEQAYYFAHNFSASIDANGLGND